MNTVEYGEVVLSRFVDPNRLIPVLNEIETDAIAEYMQSENLLMFSGLLNVLGNVRDDRVSIGSLLNTQDASGSLDRIPGAITGPHILRGWYASNGIGLWAPRIETNQPDSQAA